MPEKAETSVNEPLAWYNEHDPWAAATLRELITAGEIAPGVVDERSIEDVSPAELVRYTQRHFFAGGGVWSRAARRAGWPDSRPLVTMSCPCQPFSGAGKGEGFADERHLWPAGYWHIALGEPCPVFGEQVASDDGLAWLDAVCADLEASDYAVGPVDLCAAGFGAPHIRQRLYWMAYPASSGGRTGLCDTRQAEQRRDFASDSGGTGGLADTDGWEPGDGGVQRSGQLGLQPEGGGTGRVEYASSERREWWKAPTPRHDDDRQSSRRAEGEYGLGVSSAHRFPADAIRPGPTNGFWRDADWLRCRPEPGYPEGRWRAVEPGTFPLAHGIAERMGILRLAGNAIVSEVAEGFIRAGIEVLKEQGRW